MTTRWTIFAILSKPWAYHAWGKRFEQRCRTLTIPFWAQVNMQSLMKAEELETDENTSTQINTSEQDNSGS